jgi:hypothetical protein
MRINILIANIPYTSLLPSYGVSYLYCFSLSVTDRGVSGLECAVYIQDWYVGSFDMI